MGFKCLRQTGLLSCGPTCIQMLCLHYGKKLSVDYISETIGLSNIGSSVKGVYDGLKNLGFQSVVVKCPYEKLSQLPLPAILFWRNNHFVVLYKCDKHSFYIADPANGKIKFNKPDFLNHWNNDNQEGTAILALPTVDFYELIQPNPTSTWFKVVHDVCINTIKHKFKISIVLLLILLSCICNWYIPLLYKNLIDNGVLNGNVKVITTLFIAQFTFFIGNLLFNNLSSIILLKINSTVTISYLSNLLQKIICLPLKFFDNSLPTEMLQRFEDFTRIQNFISNTLINVSFALISLMVFSCLLAHYNVYTVIIFYTVSIIALLFNVHYLQERKYIDYTKFTQLSRNHNNILEMLKGMRDIKICNAEHYYIKKWEDSQAEINNLTLRSSIIEFKQNSSYNTINKIRDISIIAFCAILAVQGNVSIGILISITYLLGMMSSPMGTVMKFARDFQTAKISAERISNLYAKENEQSGVETPKPYSSIEIKKLYFKYPGSHSTMVLNNLNLHIPHGKITAIVGHSGCGKTTLLKLLLGFYNPTDGNIYVNNKPLIQYDIASWRKLCGTVFQDGHIFSGTIAENITMSKNFDTEELLTVCKLACVDDFICTLPLKYNTPIGVTGQDLSQGQKQRILIARALYKKPEILLFDEATSSLDSAYETQIMENIYSYCKGKTLIVIAHRLSTVKNAHQIVVLKNGVVVEMGNHKSLIGKGGTYYDLIKNQLV